MKRGGGSCFRPTLMMGESMYKVRYITTSEVTAVRYVFEEKEIEAADDADAIAKFDAECTTPLDSSIAMDIVSGEGYDWAILKSVDL